MDLVRAAMIGDVMAEPGIKALEEQLPVLIREKNLNFVVVNGENAADGFGMTEKDFQRIIASGADAVTSGNHVWEKRDFWTVLESEKNMLRPANFPKEAPGRGFVCIEKNGAKWLVINLQGREFMNAIDCPFRSFDSVMEMHVTEKALLVLVDFHAESSREKEALAYYADGRASLIAGTHTHVQTADERILPKGSAYISDLGMTGIRESVIGMEPNICIERFRTNVPVQLKPAENKPAKISGVIAEIDAGTGKAVSIQRI